MKFPKLFLPLIALNLLDIIPTNILKLLEIQISKHLADILNLSFTTGIFPSSLKSAKVIPIHKKTQNWLWLIIDQYLFFPTWDKIIEKLMYNQIIQFVEDKIN